MAKLTDGSKMGILHFELVIAMMNNLCILPGLFWLISVFFCENYFLEHTQSCNFHLLQKQDETPKLNCWKLMWN